MTNHRNNDSNGMIVSAALLLGISSLLSRLVGLLRDRVFTSMFGAGNTFDSFVVAFRIPDLIFNLVVIGALSAAFIPLFTQKMVNGKKGEEEAHRFALSILHLMGIGIGIFSICFAFFAPQIISLIAPGFSGDKLATTVMLSRIMALQPILLCISFVFSGILNSYKRFFAYALAPILYNVGIIAGAIFFVPVIGVAGLGWGVVLGALLHAGIQFPSVLRVGFRWKPVLISSSKDLLNIWRMMLPRVFGLAAQQANLFIVTIIGSGLAAGSIAAFNLANNVQYIPIGIFGIAFAQAAFPTLSEQFAKKQRAQFRHTITKSFRYIMFLVVPVSALFYLLRTQIIRVLFGHGAFSWSDTTVTYETFGFLVISIFAQATIPLLTRAFYAQHNTKMPVIISIGSIAFNTVLAFLFSHAYQVQGLALAFSLSTIVQLAVLLGILHVQLDGFDDRKVIVSISKMVIATVIAAVTTQLLKTPIAAVVDMERLWGILTQLIGSFAGGIIMYIFVCMILRSEELEIIKRYIPKRLHLPSGTDTPRFSGLID
ncbi:MAG TPA: murein biosynthesis integral membrane protein MurJ [Candidatus Andersenbacteria bacterium]|nr:murein biosynthesis integral membrane protein MurJ [Candidatus Andersenbacteria bacterium]